MSRKTASNSDSHHGLGDVIGFVLLAIALLLFVAQLSFDRHDISFLGDPHNKPLHNWIGPFGAYLAWVVFVSFGVAAYVVPPLLALFGAAYLLHFLGYLRERIRWSLLWSVMLLVAITGLLYLVDNGGLRGKFHVIIGAQSIGGWLGWLTYCQTQNHNFGFSLLGPLGATIVYSALGLISLLFLTNFRLGAWIRAFLDEEPQPESAREATKAKDKIIIGADEVALERRARELEKQAKKLQEEVARSGLGADLQPVPEPTVRDLSVPQAKPATGGRFRKTTLPDGKAPVAPEPSDEGETIPAMAIVAATTENIIGQ